MHNFFYHRLPWIVATLVAITFLRVQEGEPTPASASPSDFQLAMQRIQGEYRGRMSVPVPGKPDQRSRTTVTMSIVSNDREARIEATECGSGRKLMSVILDSISPNLVAGKSDWYQCVDLGRFGRGASDRLILSTKTSANLVRHVDIVRLENHLSFRITEGKPLDRSLKQVFDLEKIRP